MREVRVSKSPGFVSLFIYPPGILPTAYCFSMYWTVRGKKSSLTGSGSRATVANNTVFPIRKSAAPAAWRATLLTSKICVWFCKST